MNAVTKFCAVLLLVMWPVVSSHALLQLAGLIHHVHEHHHGEEGSHDHSSDSHAFADGDYVRPNAAKGLPQLKDAELFSSPNLNWITALFAEPQLDLICFGPSPPGLAPPLLQHSWLFLHRAAVPARAPSTAS